MEEKRKLLLLHTFFWFFASIGFFILIIWIRLTTRHFDIGIATAFVGGITTSMTLFFLAKFDDKNEDSKLVLENLVEYEKMNIIIQCPECGKVIILRRKDNGSYICFECRKEFTEDEIRKRCVV